MLYKVFGKPVSIVRYKLDWMKNRIISLDYRTSDKDFKICTTMDEKRDVPVVNLEGYYNGQIVNVPVGSGTFFKLSEYKAMFNNRVNGTGRTPSLNIIKNTGSDVKTIDIPFGDYEMQIPLYPKQNAVFYTDHVSIFNTADGSESARYYIQDDGIYEVSSTQSTFTYISKDDGRSSGFFSLDSFLGHEEVMPSLKYITPIALLPTRLFVSENDINGSLIFYDSYGLTKKIETNELECWYTPEYNKDNLRIRESVHHLIYDHFDFGNHFYNTRRAVAESVKMDDENKVLEYIRVIFDNLSQIKEISEYEFREQIDFDETVKQCFKY